MYQVDPTLIRSGFIGKSLKKEIEDKGLSITHIAEKTSTSRPTITNYINGKISGSDKMFSKIGEAIGLTSVQMGKIFKEADIQEYKYKYGNDIMPDLGDFSVMKPDDLEEVLLSKNGVKLSDDAKKDLKGYVEFLKSKYPSN